MQIRRIPTLLGAALCAWGLASCDNPAAPKQLPEDELVFIRAADDAPPLDSLVVHVWAKAGENRQAVIRYEKVKTTEAKAKEISGRVEKMITLAKRGDLTARRAVVAQFPNEPLVVNKLFDEIAPKYADRSSGFTRIVKIGQRRGDAAEIVQIELV
jgi:large subunit ribosomal protein L17